MRGLVRVSRQLPGCRTRTPDPPPTRCAPEAEPDGPRAGRGASGVTAISRGRERGGSPRESRGSQGARTRVFRSVWTGGLNDGGVEDSRMRSKVSGREVGGVKVCVLSSGRNFGSPGEPGFRVREVPGLKHSGART